MASSAVLTLIPPTKQPCHLACHPRLSLVTHLICGSAQCCLTSVISQQPVFSARQTVLYTPNWHPVLTSVSQPVDLLQGVDGVVEERVSIDGVLLRAEHVGASERADGGKH